MLSGVQRRIQEGKEQQDVEGEHGLAQAEEEDEIIASNLVTEDLDEVEEEDKTDVPKPEKVLSAKELREKMLPGMPPGEHVFGKKMKGVSVMIHKENDGMYCLYIDNEKLDKYPTLARAKKSAEEFVKAAKGK